MKDGRRGRKRVIGREQIRRRFNMFIVLGGRGRGGKGRDGDLDYGSYEPFVRITAAWRITRLVSCYVTYYCAQRANGFARLAIG